MIHHSVRAGLIAGLWLVLGFTPGIAAEKWADPRLRLTAGLELWLDAGRQNAARRDLGQPDLVHGLALGRWIDASGTGRHLLQPDRAAQPYFHTTGAYTALRFDGERQHLSLTGLDRTYEGLTLFVVAVPFANDGGFRAFLALNRDGQNDYVSGLTIDQGPAATPGFHVLNVEGAGFGGARNLLSKGTDFGTVQRLCVTSAVSSGGTKLYVNGQRAGQRDRGPSTLRMDRFTIGARFYTNGGPPQVRGFGHADLLEVLLYDRVLSAAERAQVDDYLAARYGALGKVPLPARPGVGKPLITLADAPPVQVFVPGFSVRQLPVDLTNINNIQYRPDGKLVALAYSGDVYLLSDNDGDGLEDRATLFWENRGRLRAPIGMALTPPGYAHGNGLFVASKGKCSLIVASRGGDRADKEIVIADRWQELPHGVDALGVALDPRDQSVYFGLGAASYTDAYLLGKEGKSRYQLDGERGTILRVAPDFKSRAIVCTGIRFPVGLRFNRAGDLFCTDQEGATWLANGNPLDELLYIEKGRHYGFPPRHPRHLPGVIDEPSVFDYAPQHQSTCGLNFNEPVNGGPIVGPAWWRSDAFVAGYSRGKLYRTQLVKTTAGYVAQNRLIAALGMLAVDACISPQGDLVIATHGGGPDWGSGPTGKGKLFKLSYTGKELPQPVLAWAQTPREVRVAFDRPLAPEHLSRLADASIEFGPYVAAGDRFERHRPGYQVVQDQLRAPRAELPIVGVQVTADRRTLLLATAPHVAQAGYALTLPGLGRPARSDVKPGELPQIPETDLRYDLCGVEATWQPRGNLPSWTGWLPHLDLAAARQLTAASAPHDELWQRMQQPGILTLRTRLDLWQMLRPAVQPGSTVDYELPGEEVTLVLRQAADFAVRSPTRVKPATEADGRRVARVTVKPAANAPVLLEVVLPTGGAVADLSIAYHTREDARPRTLPLRRFLLPWAATQPDAPRDLAQRDIPELKGGDWGRGRHVFFSDEAGCARCHRVAGQGSDIGPDLSNLAHRDYASVLRDISEPSYAIHPDYITQLIALKDGRVLTGSVRSEGERLHVGDNQGRLTTLRRDEIESMIPAAVSIMPEGLPKQLGPAKMKDLLTFLLADPPRMPEYGKGTPPPPRKLREVQAVLAGAPAAPAKLRPLHVVLVAGKKDHGLGEHDYPAWLKVWERLFSLAENVRLTTAMEWPSVDELRTADVMVFYQRGKWTPERARAIDAYLERGGGLVYIHWAVEGEADAPGFAQRIGLAFQQKQSKFRHGPLELGFETGPRHPLARNFDKLQLVDESYWKLTGDPNKLQILARGIEEGEAQPLFWTLEPSKGRVFVSIPGHFAWTFDDPLFRVLLLRGIAWAAREPVDRFNGLVLPGARVGS
jgi:putative heme-binding domain-containing protein